MPRDSQRHPVSTANRLILPPSFRTDTAPGLAAGDVIEHKENWRHVEKPEKADRCMRKGKLWRTSDGSSWSPGPCGNWTCDKWCAVQNAWSALRRLEYLFGAYE